MATQSRAFFALCRILPAAALFCAVAAVFAADNSGAALSGAAAAKSLEHIKQQDKPIKWQGSGSLPVSGEEGASTYEVTGFIQGRIGWDGRDTLLLKLSAVTVDAVIDHNMSATWLNSGIPLRILLQDNTSSAPASVDYRIVAVAPDADVTALESAAAQQRVTAGRAFTETSRSRIQPRSLQVNLPAGHPICRFPENILAVYPSYRAVVRGYNRRLSEDMVDKITSSVLGYSNYYRVDPRLIMAMLIAESGFDPNCISRTGATGLGQLMPNTAAELGVDPRDPVSNVGAAAKILSDHITEYGGSTPSGLVPINTLLLTMAAYNAGGGAVKRYHGVPPYRETQNYVRKVSALYRQMCGKAGQSEGNEAL